MLWTVFLDVLSSLSAFPNDPRVDLRNFTDTVIRYESKELPLPRTSATVQVSFKNLRSQWSKLSVFKRCSTCYSTGKIWSCIKPSCNMQICIQEQGQGCIKLFDKKMKESDFICPSCLMSLHKSMPVSEIKQ